MLLFLLLLVVYVLTVFSERRLVMAGPADWERYRRPDNGTSTALLTLMKDIRPALSALMLARILLVLLMAISIFVVVYNAQAIRQAIADYHTLKGWNTQLLWMGVALVCALGLAFLLWAAQRFLRPLNTWPSLNWVCHFSRFWQRLLRPLLRKGADTVTEPLSQSLLSDKPDTADRQLPGRSDLALLKGIVKFTDVTVKQAMQPRAKVVAADFRFSFGELLALARSAGFSRMPVFDEDLDNITGILYVKDLVAHLDKAGDFEWQALIRPNVLQVPESKHVSDLLEDFKRQKLHMAIVVDEYGGTSGIVTMEDVLEEILGEIRDEFDEESEVRYRKLDEHTYLFDGQTLLSDVCRLTNLPENAFQEVRGNADTLAGLALELSGDIPSRGKELHWNGFTLMVIAADNRRIKQIRLTLPQA
ncbi:MAG: transporter associated domain-containing protein [Saprospiraceae bacterium]|nr:transporter associated domain-containing protein [Saprospiraceae bacterium]